VKRPAAITSIALGFFLTTFATAQLYTVREIALQADDTDATALNAHGEVVGTYRNPITDVVHAFLFNRGGLIDDLGTLGGSRSFGQGINNHAVITGYSQITGDLSVHAFSFKDGVMSDLGTLGGDSSQAFGINSSGQITGNAQLRDGPVHAFLFNQGNMMDLGTVGGTTSFGLALNRFGNVTGASYLLGDSVYHAFLYEHGSMTDLGSLLLFSEGLAINDKNQVVGITDVPGGSHAFLLTDGKMSDLGTLGGTVSQAMGVNNAGHVVGTASLTGDQASHAFIYVPGSGMLDLNTLIPPESGWTLQVARAINDREEIVGFGLINGQSRAFLLKPHHPLKF
jgi:probable HAF family extracellular repeat protein